MLHAHHHTPTHTHAHTHFSIIHPFTVKINFPFSGKVPHPLPMPLPGKAEAGSLGRGWWREGQAGRALGWILSSQVLCDPQLLAISDPPLVGKWLSVWLPLDGFPSPLPQAVSPPALTTDHTLPFHPTSSAAQRTLWL